MSVMCSPTGAMGAMGWPLGLAVMLGFWGPLPWLGVGQANISGNLTSRATARRPPTTDTRAPAPAPDRGSAAVDSELREVVLVLPPAGPGWLHP